MVNHSKCVLGEFRQNPKSDLCVPSSQTQSVALVEASPPPADAGSVRELVGQAVHAAEPAVEG